MVYILLRFLSFIILKFFFRLQIHGKKNIPKKGGFILASNHTSYLDPIAVGVSCPRKLNFLARHDLFSQRFFSWLLFSVRAFPVKRDSADASALKEAMRRIRNGQGLLLFPEGRRKELNSVPGGPQAGIGFLAAKLNVPVIPVFVKGTDRALPKGAKLIHLSKIAVFFSKALRIEKGLSYQQIAEHVMSEIKRLERGEIENDRN